MATSKTPLCLTNSTVSNNYTANYGGGISNDGTLTVTDSTVSGNESAMDGGGIFNYQGTVTLTNSIIANSPNGFDCAVSQSTTITSMGHHLDGDGSCGLDGPGDKPNTDPMLGPLQDNGGPTLTHVLLESSPDIDSGDNSVLEGPLNLSINQRGAGFPRLQGPPCGYRGL